MRDQRRAGFDPQTTRHTTSPRLSRGGWLTGLALAVCSIAGRAETLPSATAPAPAPTPARTPAAPPLTSAVLVDEVMSQSSGPHVFDWRKSAAEIELGYVYVDEANNFESWGAELIGSIPSDAGVTFRFGLRRFWLESTESAELIEKTPFRQKAQPTRYEIMGGLGVSLLEGRSFSRLSPWMGDLEHVLQGLVGLHYNHPNDKWIPARSDKPDARPGQEISYAKLVAEIGLRWQVYFPSSLGLFLGVDRQIPLGAAPPRVMNYSLGLVWAIGG